MATNQQAAAWSAPYLGVQHLTGKTSRASVTDYGSFAELLRWFPGCGFSPIKSQHASASEAREAGAKWLAEAA